MSALLGMWQRDPVRVIAYAVLASSMVACALLAALGGRLSDRVLRRSIAVAFAVGLCALLVLGVR